MPLNNAIKIPTDMCFLPQEAIIDFWLYKNDLAVPEKSRYVCPLPILCICFSFPFYKTKQHIQGDLSGENAPKVNSLPFFLLHTMYVFKSFTLNTYVAGQT